MIDVAVVGLGWWGKKLSQAIRESSALRVVRGIEPSAAALAGFGDDCGFPIAKDIGVALDDPSVSAVLLATPHSLHDEQIAQAAEAGKHVFCEKPLSLSRAGAARSIELMRRKGLVLGIGHERRWEPPIAEMLADARAEIRHAAPTRGQFQPRQVRLPVLRQLAIVRSERAGRRHDGDRNPSVRLGDGDVRRGRAGLRQHRDAGQRNCQRRLRPAPSSATRVAQRLMSRPCWPHRSSRAYAVFGSQGWMEVRDKAHLEASDGWIVTRCGSGGQPVTREAPVAKSVLANLEAFARAITGEALYPISMEEMVANTAVMEAIFTSARSRRAQVVPS